jgi:uncharacterized protein YkwD
MHRSPFLVGLVMFVILGVRSDAADKDSPEKPKLSKAALTILRLTNEQRAEKELPPLKPNALLMTLAQKHSENMAKQGKLAHVLDEKTPADRAVAAGYHRYVGENVAGGPRLTAKNAFELWLDSEPHKKNIVGERYDEIGIGIARAENGEVYYTQVFGMQKNPEGENPSKSVKKPADKSENPAFDKARAEILKRTNEARAKEKLEPLKLSPVLTRVANAHSANMAKQEKMAHVLDDKRPGQRIAAAAYKYEESGENVAMSEDIQVEDIFDAWMKSKEHRENILGEDFQEIGIGLAKSDKGDIYYTQVFAKPKKK